MSSFEEYLELVDFSYSASSYEQLHARAVSVSNPKTIASLLPMISRVDWMAQLIDDLGFDVNTIDLDGSTVLRRFVAEMDDLGTSHGEPSSDHWCRSPFYLDRIRAVVERGSNVFGLVPFDRCSAIEHAFRGMDRSTDLAFRLDLLGLALASPDGGRTGNYLCSVVFTSLANESSSDDLRAALDIGADPNEVSKFGGSMMHLTAYIGHVAKPAHQAHFASLLQIGQRAGGRLDLPTPLAGFPGLDPLPRKGIPGWGIDGKFSKFYRRNRLLGTVEHFIKTKRLESFATLLLED